MSNQLVLEGYNQYIKYAIFYKAKIGIKAVKSNRAQGKYLIYNSLYLAVYFIIHNVLQILKRKPLCGKNWIVYLVN